MLLIKKTRLRGTTWALQQAKQPTTRTLLNSRRWFIARQLIGNYGIIASNWVWKAFHILSSFRICPRWVSPVFRCQVSSCWTKKIVDIDADLDVESHVNIKSDNEWVGRKRQLRAQVRHLVTSQQYVTLLKHKWLHRFVTANKT